MVAVKSGQEEKNFLSAAISKSAAMGKREDPGKGRD